MKSPRPVGGAIDMRRVSGWLDDFANYRYTITERRIERWLSQFDLPDIDLAARVLDVVDFISNDKISRAYRSGLNAIHGWNSSLTKREGTWRFAAFSSSAGESGDVMLQRLRHANNLASKANNELFVHRSELLNAGLKAGDKIVLVDDFSATGNQVTEAWPGLSEILPEGPDVYLLLVAASRDALTRIVAETELLVHADIILEPRDGVFHDDCTHFTPPEKTTIRRYCKAVGPKSASDYATSGYTIVFAHTCPNNTLPMLHSVRTNDPEWEGLFRRYDNQ